MHPSLAQLSQAIAAAAKGEPLFTLSEGLVKVKALHAALDLGWTVQDGSSGAGQMHTLSRLHGQPIKLASSPRVLNVAEGSADLYVTAPVQMMLEIKTRPDFGSKETAQFAFILEDVERVASTPNTAFLFCFDQRLYRAFSGERADPRGRPALSSQWFHDNFIGYDEVVGNALTDTTATANGVQLDLQFHPVPGGVTGTRVIVVGARSDSSFGTPAGQ